MRTNKKFVSSLLAAAFISTAAAGSALAFDGGEAYGDATGDQPLTIRQMQIANEKALRDARNNRLLILDVQGSYNGEERLTADQQAAFNVASAKGSKPILPFIGDWNGTAKAGFPHK
ncbi:MAG: hypothetical protein AAGA50_24075 [Pseudomonadota bacterium]